MLSNGVACWNQSQASLEAVLVNSFLIWNLCPSTLNAGGSVLKGLGSVFQALMAYKNYGLAKDQMQQSTDAFNINTANQTALLNDRIRDVNAFKTAQNMKNLGTTLPNYQLPGGSKTLIG